MKSHNDTAREPIHCSSRLAFLPGRGVSVRYEQLRPDATNVLVPQVRILVFPGPEARCEVAQQGGAMEELCTHRTEGAAVAVIGAHVPHLARWPEGTRLVDLALEPRFVYETVKAPIRGITLGDLDVLARRDAMISQMVGAIVTFLRGEWRPTPLYVESIATVLATHVIRSIFAGEPPVDRRSGLPIDVMQRVVAHIDQNYVAEYDSEELAAVAGYSRNHFARLFQKSLNQTPRAYYRGCQVEKAIDLLQTTNRKMLDIAHACGFCDETQMARWFWDLRRIVPREVRNAARR